jgi:hypothetical protein
MGPGAFAGGIVRVFFRRVSKLRSAVEEGVM